MNITVTIEREFRGKVMADWLRRVARAVLRAENASRKSEVGLIITGQERIRELNRHYLDEDAPTDVLSFPMIEYTAEGADFVNPPDDTISLGEVIISYPQAEKQALERKHPVRKEIALLIIHGILHLLGYDHDNATRKRKMRARETAILKTIEERLL
jgi:probable rRNA maturation factor